MKTIHVMTYALLLVAYCCTGCATPPTPRPIAYLSVEIPDGVIKTSEDTSVDENTPRSGFYSVEEKFSRGGFYFVKYNFRPAPDIASYIEQAGQMAGTEILRNADVKLVVPFYLDILFFGFGFGTDTVTATAN